MRSSIGIAAWLVIDDWGIYLNNIDIMCSPENFAIGICNVSDSATDIAQLQQWEVLCQKMWGGSAPLTFKNVEGGQGVKAPGPLFLATDIAISL